ncbi:MAG TPA: hypothetical protein VM142_10470 [Acidimicrobiales bacterium]|nr:hypothetical protein [Acidimicrobiales bacterium]
MTSEDRPLEIDRGDVPAPVGDAGEAHRVKRWWARPSRWGIAGLLIVAPLFFGLLFRSNGPVERDFFIEAASTFTVGAGPTPVGSPHFFHVVTPRPLGKRPVHLLSAEILGVPKGLVIDGAWAVRFSETGGGGYVGGANGPEVAAQLRPHFHDLSEVVLDPSCPPSARCGQREGPGLAGSPVQDWYLIVEMHATRPGHFKTQGFRVIAEVDGRKLIQNSFRKKFEVNSKPRGLRTT